MVGKAHVLAISSSLAAPTCRAEYMEPSEITSFQGACVRATVQNLDDALRLFFATWTTSLLGSDLKKLKSRSTEPRTRTLIETLVIQDEYNTLDPFTVPGLLSPDPMYRIWPGQETMRAS